MWMLYSLTIFDLAAQRAHDVNLNMETDPN